MVYITEIILISSIASSTNLVKNCVGAGVFSLSSRLAAISIDPKTQAMASLLIFAMAGWATYNFFTIGTVIISFPPKLLVD
jgi:hypothetical protein